jgi:CRP/FNR family transcriptional regulator, anaerobic regulatory protein
LTPLTPQPLARAMINVVRRVPAGTIVFRPDEDCPGFVSVRTGQLKVVLSAANGREIVLYRVRPGEICLQTFACLIEGRRYTAQGVAEVESEIELIAPTEFHRRMREDSNFRDQLLQAIATRFNDFERRVEDIALSGLQPRLARALLRLADIQGEVRATHEELAAEIASAREVVSRQLARFASDGAITATRGLIRIADGAKLRQLANSEGD